MNEGAGTHPCLVSTRLNQAVSTAEVSWNSRSTLAPSAMEGIGLGFHALSNLSRWICQALNEVQKCFHIFIHPTNLKSTEWTESSSKGVPIIWKWTFYLHRAGHSCYSLKNQRCTEAAQSSSLKAIPACFPSVYWFWHLNFSLDFLRNTFPIEALISVSALPGEVLTIIYLNRPSPPATQWECENEGRVLLIIPLMALSTACSPFKGQNPVLKKRKQGHDSSRGSKFEISQWSKRKWGKKTGFFIISSWCHFSIIK